MMELGIAGLKKKGQADEIRNLRFVRTTKGEYLAEPGTFTRNTGTKYQQLPPLNEKKMQRGSRR